MLEHRAPLDQCSQAVDTGPIDRPDLHVAPVADRGLLLLQGDPRDALFCDVIFRQIDIRVPGPRATSTRGDYALLWVTPREWLLELPADEAAASHEALASRLAPVLAAVSDVSDAYASFEVTGERAVEALMTGCSVDLHLHAFGAGSVACTTVADVPAIVWRPENLRLLRCLVDRSFAAHFWNWLADGPGRW